MTAGVDGAGSKRRVGLGLAIGLVGLLVVLCGVGYVGMQMLETARREAARADTPELYADMAAILATPMTVVGTVPESLSQPEQIREAERLMTSLHRVAQEGRELSRHADHVLGSVERAVELERSRPDAWGLLGGAACVALGVATRSDELMASGGRDAIETLGKFGEFLQQAQTIKVRMHANALAFSEWAPARFSGDVGARSRFSAKFEDPAEGIVDALRGLDNDEHMLTLRNDSPEDLHDCFVIVRFKNDDGETMQALHFVRDWPSAQERYAAYSDMWLFEEIVDEPTSVTVTVFARESSSPAFTLKPGPFGW